MSVIGRLDKGVEALLINPLRERQTPDEEKHERPRRNPVPAPEERAAESLAEERVRRDERLPIWML